MKKILLCLALILTPLAAMADGPLQTILQDNRALVEKPSRQTIGAVLDRLTGTAGAQAFLEAFQAKAVWVTPDGRFLTGAAGNLSDPDTGAPVEAAAARQVKPNSGVRRLIAAALVQYQLSDPDPEKRWAALESLARGAGQEQLAPLRASLDGETDPALLVRKTRLLTLLTIVHDPDPEHRVAAIESVSGEIEVEVRAALNPVLSSTRAVAKTIPPGTNIARVLKVGDDLDRADAVAMLIKAGLLTAPLDTPEVKAVLADNIDGGRVGDVPLALLDRPEKRAEAYAALERQGKAAPITTPAEIDAALQEHVFFDRYAEPNAEVTAAALAALNATRTNVALAQAADVTLDALSLASIYFLAAIGLAITFGVMGVINMAHGEFIMMGAYTGYVVQQVVPNHTVSLLIALPLAFVVTFAAGVALERTVIRRLYHRPLETLLATFGVSIALQQLAKNIFGTQARPLTAPGWLDGALVVNDVVSISFIRIAIFVLALSFLALFLYIMRRTRLGLETRAVTQNPAMAASMGINPDRVNMLTFGLGSGIAGIAGVAIGLFAKVTSELGSDYIVQSFMTVVVGGVGNIWGTLAGAAMIGTLQKGIEWMNPSNTLAAQTFMIIFIIIFIQFRPRGIVALRGRAAGD